jgi:hypothetical protein
MHMKTFNGVNHAVEKLEPRRMSKLPFSICLASLTSILQPLHAQEQPEVEIAKIASQAYELAEKRLKTIYFCQDIYFQENLISGRRNGISLGRAYSSINSNPTDEKGNSISRETCNSLLTENSIYATLKMVFPFMPKDPSPIPNYFDYRFEDGVMVFSFQLRFILKTYNEMNDEKKNFHYIIQDKFREFEKLKIEFNKQKRRQEEEKRVEAARADWLQKLEAARIEKEIADRKKASFRNFKQNSLVDSVARVLNFSSGCPDEGCDDSFWYRSSTTRCIYSKAIQQGINDFNRSASVIDLDNLDPRGIRFSSQSGGTRVTYDGSSVIASASEIDLERLRRGWELIYNKFCKGIRREF